MPHLIVEYTDNLDSTADIDALLHKASAVLLDQGGAYPVGGVRCRAICLRHYCVGDGTADGAFVHLTLKMGAGRSAARRQQTGDDLFAMVKAHFAEIFAARAIALSLDIQEFSEAGTWKHNNLHQLYASRTT